MSRLYYLFLLLTSLTHAQEDLLRTCYSISYKSSDLDKISSATKKELILSFKVINEMLSPTNLCLSWDPLQKSLLWSEVPIDMSCLETTRHLLLSEWKTKSTPHISLEKDQLRISYAGKDNEKIVKVFTLYNLEDKSNYHHLDRLKGKRFFSGVVILPNAKNVLRSSPPEEGTSQSIFKSTPCGGVDKNCEPINSNYSCDEFCTKGWYWAPNGCPGIGTKFCGIDQCGEKEQPACFRGYGQKTLTQPKDRRSNLGFVFCQNGLRPTFEGDFITCL